MNGLRFLSLLLAIVALAGCQKPATPALSAAGDPGEPTQALPKLQTMKLWLGPEEMIAELALTTDQQQTGMMFRTNLAENAGMLFAFAVPRRAAFWMKNCVVPLSAAYINAEGVILELHDFEPGNTNAVVAASDRVQFVLETPRGWFKRHNVAVGAVVRTERGSLAGTFSPR